MTLEPDNQYTVLGGNATFTARGAGLYGVTYVWQTNGVNLSGATSATLSLTDVQAVQAGVGYDVIATDNTGIGSITSSIVQVYLATPPVITSQTLPANQLVVVSNSLTLSTSISAPYQTNGFPLTYQWQFDGTNILHATSTNYTFIATNAGTYSLVVSNGAGSVTNSWQVTLLYPGNYWAWGDNAYNESSNSLSITNIAAIAAGEYSSVAAEDNGTVIQWGTNSVNVPNNLTNAVAVAAGNGHSIALRTDGTLVAWGLNNFQQTNVPPNTTNIIAVAAGGQESLALLNNGTVVQWGLTNGPIPAGLANVTAIAAGTNFNLALLQNSTVVAWGLNNFGQTNIPPGLSNVVAIAAGGSHALALEQNGTVIAWGDNTYGETNVPPNLTNAMNVAAGENHSVALKNDGTVIAWGDNTYGQTNTQTLTQVKLLAAGGNHTLAGVFSPTVMYPINVANDLLLIYNTNSVASTIVEQYYLQNRPLVGSANVFGIGCSNVETVPPSYFTNVIISQIQSWLTANPTIRPQYVILFYDLPSRVNTNNVDGILNPPIWPSAQYRVSTGCSASWNPFVTSINFNTTNDCIGYIDKLKYIGTNYSQGRVVISAGTTGKYADTNYYFDDTESPYRGYTPGLDASNGVVQAGISPASVVYTNIVDNGTLMGHITNGANVAGYLCWGENSRGLSGGYATNGFVQLSGNSGWWIIQTIESFNGQRESDQGNFIKWFATNAFGGPSYSSTPVGGVSSTDEPYMIEANTSAVYFGLWASGKNLAICAWNSRNTDVLQVLGDPFVTR
jgi:hypothetical protein